LSDIFGSVLVSGIDIDKIVRVYNYLYEGLILGISKQNEYNRQFVEQLSIPI